MSKTPSTSEPKFQTDPVKAGHSAQERIIDRALADDSFRQALINDPKKTIASELNAKLPAGLTVRIVEDDANTVTIVLPYKMTPSDTAALKALATESHLAANSTTSTAIQFTLCC